MKLKNSWNKDEYGYGLKPSKQEIALGKAIKKIKVVKPKSRKKVTEDDK